MFWKVHEVFQGRFDNFLLLLESLDKIEIHISNNEVTDLMGPRKYTNMPMNHPFQYIEMCANPWIEFYRTVLVVALPNQKRIITKSRLDD